METISICASRRKALKLMICCFASVAVLVWVAASSQDQLAASTFFFTKVLLGLLFLVPTTVFLLGALYFLYLVIQRPVLYLFDAEGIKSPKARRVIAWKDILRVYTKNILGDRVIFLALARYDSKFLRHPVNPSAPPTAKEFTIWLVAIEGDVDRWVPIIEARRAGR